MLLLVHLRLGGWERIEGRLMADQQRAGSDEFKTLFEQIDWTRLRPIAGDRLAPSIQHGSDNLPNVCQLPGDEYRG
jgi:hypothetical protein